MNALNLAENIIRLRHEKKITQEQLADFVGVTKASVSKWETRQSMPDILLLPHLAAFFDVTIDELLGYEPQLSREQMQKIYLELAAAFAKEPFEEVIERVEKLKKEYYNCYPFLYQLTLLYLNHFMLAGDRERQQEILEIALHLSDHILADCKEISICNETVVLRAMILLQLGKAFEVIESLLLLWSFCYWMCYGITYGYNEYFWDNSIAEDVEFATFCVYMLGVWLIALMMLLSTLFSSGASGFTVVQLVLAVVVFNRKDV